MSKWTKNVGTPEHPVSYLHEYAVALIWDRLSAGGCFLKTTSSNEYEHISVPEGGRIAIPDELTPIAGMVPDIAVYDSDHRPVTVVEVQVTRAPSENKRERLERLGVKMIVVPVPNEEALLTMFRPVSVEELFHGIQIPRRFSGHSNLVKKQLMPGYADSSALARVKIDGTLTNINEANKAVENLILSIRQCDPSLRQELRAVLDELDSIESQHPILSGNPKLPVLQQDDKADEVE
ncbi:MAG: hypothetical protein F4X57_06335 [Chloroflexi bacterium]|nr:hypothetical protein [Chloroflexota bacterium]